MIAKSHSPIMDEGGFAMDDRWSFLNQSDEDITQALARCTEDEPDLGAWLRDRIDASNERRAAAVRRSELDPTFAYQIISGQRRGSRDKLLQLARGMRLGIDETDELLERGGVSALRPYARRDVVIAFCITRNMDVARCDAMLLSAGMRPLRNK